MKIHLAILTASALALGACEEPKEAPELPPAGALPLSQIVRIAEDAKLGTIVEIEFEDGVWEIEIVSGDEEIEIDIDPLTGEVIPDD